MLLKLLTSTPLLSLLLGPLVTLAVDGVKRLWGWLDRQGALTKQAFAVVVAFALVGLAQLVPGVVPEACTNVLATGISGPCQDALTSKVFVEAILTALVGIAVKHGQQATDRVG